MKSEDNKPVSIIAVNGSPRKSWNTATLLGKALDGAASRGAATELIHLYDLNFKGCVSCFACKLLGGPSYGRCVIRDDLTPVFEKIEQCDGIILGSPIYLGTVSGEMQSFMERLIFARLTYTDPPGTLFPKKIPSACIYTMGLPEELMPQYGYEPRFANIERMLKIIFGSAESLRCFDTLQFADYSKYHAPRWDPQQKAQRRREVFPQDCRKAFDLGARLAGEGEERR